MMELIGEYGSKTVKATEARMRTEGDGCISLYEACSRREQASEGSDGKAGSLSTSVSVYHHMIGLKLKRKAKE